VIPVLTGATGTISKLLTKFLSNIRGKYEIGELKKTFILGTVHILQKVPIKSTKYATGEIALHVL
jgi:hypothetical protein